MLDVGLSIAQAPPSLFNLTNITEYQMSLTVDHCDDKLCEGKGLVIIKDPKTKKVIQAISSDDLIFFKDSLNKTSTKDTVLYDEQGPVILGDFNFDGHRDLAVRNGNKSGYHGPSYDIYLFNLTEKRFVLNQQFTKLATENLGMFFVDPEKKLLTTFTKDGCCWHQSSQYEVINNKIKLVSKLTEDAITKHDIVIITDEKLINGKWITTTKEVPTKEYYKD